MKLPEKPHDNASNFEKLEYYKALQQYTDMQREKNEVYYENRIEKLNRNIAIVLACLAMLCAVIGYLYLNR